MHMKKVSASVLVLAMLLAIFCIPAAAAGAELTVKAPETLPKKGETFEVTVELASNPGIYAMEFKLAFNSKEISCSRVQRGELLSGIMIATNPKAPGGAMAAIATVEPVEGDGTFLVFSFEAEADVTDYGFAIVGTALRNSSGKPMPFTVAIDAPQSSATSGTPTTPGGSGTKPTVQTVSFPDIQGHWGEEFILQAAELGLFKGYEDGTFKPDAPVNRAQFVTVVWRMAGSPQTDATTPFADIAGLSGEFKTAIAWAYEKGLINGTSETAFSPLDSLNRAAAMKILFQYAGGVSGMEMTFTGIYDSAYEDSAQIPDWAKAPMYWGVYNEIISGTGKTTLSPAGTATRAQLAKILVNYTNLHEGGAA